MEQTQINSTHELERCRYGLPARATPLTPSRPCLRREPKRMLFTLGPHESMGVRLPTIHRLCTHRALQRPSYGLTLERHLSDKIMEVGWLAQWLTAWPARDGWRPAIGCPRDLESSRAGPRRACPVAFRPIRNRDPARAEKLSQRSPRTHRGTPASAGARPWSQP